MNLLDKKIIDFNNKRFITYPKMEEMGLKNIFTTIDSNMGMVSCGVDEELVKQYGEVKELLNEGESKLYLLVQEHTDIALIAGKEGENEERPYGYVSKNADGLISNEKGLVTVSTVADCVPVVLFDRKNRAYANIHSGWKGTYKNIVGKTIEKMEEEFKTSGEDILAFIGPHIQVEDFEVREDVETLFRNKYGYIDNLIRKKDEDHFLIDLNLVLLDSLKKKGVREENIYISPDSTVSMADLYHSFRRDGKKFGIMSMCIALKNK